MTNASVRHRLTGRDYEILLSLDRCPLTARQLLKLSETFQSGAFQSVRSVQDRLAKLAAAGWVRRWPLATASRGGSPDYCKLTLLGYRLLYGARAKPPTKRYFNEVALAHQHHTHSLSEFVVHTAVAAHRRGIAMKHFSRENTLRLQVGLENLFPDCAFELHTPAGQQYNFLVELDNGTERVRSERDAESWQRKIRLYEQFQDQVFPYRFRVLVVTTRSRDRLDHILAVASQHARNPRRSLFYAACLGDYLLQADAIGIPGFRDHHGRQVAMIPAEVRSGPARLPGMLSPASRPSGNLCPLPVATSPSPREPRSSGLLSPTS
ncbi:MAG: replication-relaxation family protein [candidate division Zixibacteria bacterium]|nr:replication-relaxation family protein [candidate division Zixibacteria bacterium]